MKLVIGNDHAAVELKNEIKAYLEEKGYEVINIGTDTHDSCNYPEYGEKAGRMVAAGEVDGGVLICGTGVGISIAANKVNGVRAAVCLSLLPHVLSKSTTMQISLHSVQESLEARLQKQSLMHG